MTPQARARINLVQPFAFSASGHLVWRVTRIVLSMTDVARNAPNTNY